MFTPNPAHSEQRARDALTFDPFPSSEWVYATDDGIVIRSPQPGRENVYGAFVPGRRLLPGNIWLLPFSAQDQIRRDWAKIHIGIKHALSWQRQQERLLPSGRFHCTEVPPHEVPGFRTFRPEFRSDRGPFVPLNLEYIDWRNTRGGMMPKLIGVAKARGRSNGRWVLDHIDSTRNFAESNSTGSRGVVDTYRLYHGPIYSVRARATWRGAETYFVHVRDCEKIRLSEAEVLECLER